MSEGHSTRRCIRTRIPLTSRVTSDSGGRRRSESSSSSTTLTSATRSATPATHTRKHSRLVSAQFTEIVDDGEDYKIVAVCLSVIKIILKKLVNQFIFSRSIARDGTKTPTKWLAIDHCHPEANSGHPMYSPATWLRALNLTQNPAGCVKVFLQGGLHPWRPKCLELLFVCSDHWMQSYQIWSDNRHEVGKVYAGSTSPLTIIWDHCVAVICALLMMCALTSAFLVM